MTNTTPPDRSRTENRTKNRTVPRSGSQESGHVPGYPRPADGGPQAIKPERGEGYDGTGPDGKPKPPKIGRPDGLAPNLKGAPDDVITGAWAWLAVASFQILYAIVQFLANLSDDRGLRRSITQMMDDNSNIPADIRDNVSLDTLVMGANVMSSLSIVIAALLCMFLTFRAARGAVYSRMFLNVGSVYLMLTALLMAFSSGPDSMSAAFALILGILAILSGVAGVLGVWFMARPGNEEWFGIPSAEEYEKYAKKVEEQREREKKAKDKRDKREQDKAKK